MFHSEADKAVKFERPNSKINLSLPFNPYTDSLLNKSYEINFIF